MIEIIFSRSSGPPWSGRALPRLMSLPPMKANSETSTFRPSGTRMSEPPIREKTRISTTSAASSASLRSRLLPPMRLSTVTERPTRQWPLRSLPPITETTQRVPPSPGRTGRSEGRARLSPRSSTSRSSSPRVLAA